ncbi:unnamed protein product, partial [Polarella glacialis]
SGGIFIERPPDKVNYRSIGRGSGGVLPKHRSYTIRDDAQRLGPSTIPAKFETVLFKDNHEKKGFGGSATRFVEQRPQPGPGEHGDGGLSSVLSPRCASAGRRGCGPFASRTPRIPHPSATHGYVPPGPGAYNTAEDGPASARGFQAPTPHSAGFALPVGWNPYKYDVPTPGPGCYFGPDGEQEHVRHRGAGCSFGGAERDSANAVEETPGPGFYTADLEDPQFGFLSTSTSSKGMRMSSRRKLLPVESSVDRVVEVTETAKFRHRVEELTKTQPSSGSYVPGPGDYSPNVEAVKGKMQFSARGLSSFQLGTSHMARTLRPTAPGPGEYTVEEPKSPTTVRGMLDSQTRRFKDPTAPAAGPPGPAYYSPHHPSLKKESYHLNQQKSWI